MQKIKLTIANRVYPLNVPLEQEEGLRVASKKIDIMIKHFEENYAVKDKQDVLAMYKEKFDEAISRLLVLGEGRLKRDNYRNGEPRMDM